MAEPAYRTAYEKDGAHICPECGVDFKDQKRANVLAHAIDHWPDIPSGEQYNVARERRAQVEKIAKELGD